MNAHNRVWGSSDINGKGESLLNFFAATQVNILNCQSRQIIEATVATAEASDISYQETASDYR